MASPCRALNQSRRGLMHYSAGCGKGVRNLFSLCADACGESDEIVSAEKVPGTSSELMPLLVQEAMRYGDREV